MTDIDSIATRAELVAAWEAGARPDFILFWGHTGAADKVGPFVLSQWRPAPFEVDGNRYTSAEHYMMAEKARLMGDQATCAEIIACHDPGKAKALGRRITPWDEERWRAHRFDIVVAGSVAKFGQDRRLRDYLTATAGKVLAEASPQDRIWGIGLARDEDAARDPSEWRGQNLLGFALMKARQLLLADGPDGNL